MALAFVGITLAWSMYRFRALVGNLKVPDQIDPDEGLDYFQATIAQKVSISKSQVEFGVGLICSVEISADKLAAFIKVHQRAELDEVIQVNDCVGLIVGGERGALERAVVRWGEELGVVLRVGASFFSGKVRTSQELISAAEEALLLVPSTGGWVWAEVDAEASDTEADDAVEDDETESDSSIDSLTGVLAPNKVASYMRKYIGEYRRTHQLALFFIGINGMTDVEELHGKDACDAVRKAVSELIQNALREDDVIGRYDENEFLALMLCDEQHVAGIANRIRDRSQKLLVCHHNRRIKVTLNIGAAMCPRHGRSLPAMFGAAKGAYDVAQRRQGSMCVIAGEK